MADYDQPRPDLVGPRDDSPRHFGSRNESTRNRCHCQRKGFSMGPRHDEIPGVTDDPVLRRILEGRASTLDEAEELYLDESLLEILELLGTATADDELARHPLLTLLRLRGSRGREDSIL
jgi:hypothetical protein